MEKKGVKLSKKGYRRGFLNHGVSRGNPSSSSSSSSGGASYEATKRQHISEVKRLLTIRNEYVKIRKSTNRTNDPGFIDDREREAFTAFNALFAAEPGLMTDPDVMKVIEQSHNELEEEGLVAEEDEDMGLKVGKEVRIIGGSHIGKKAKVLEVMDEDDLVSLRFLNGEEAVAWVGNVAGLGSLAEDMCLMKLMAPPKSGDGKEADEEMRFMEMMMKSMNIMEKGYFSKK